jgi:hypothetical protein
LISLDCGDDRIPVCNIELFPGKKLIGNPAFFANSRKGLAERAGGAGD